MAVIAAALSIVQQISLFSIDDFALRIVARSLRTAFNFSPRNRTISRGISSSFGAFSKRALGMRGFGAKKPIPMLESVHLSIPCF
jgi:hypothetical protein